MAKRRTVTTITDESVLQPAEQPATQSDTIAAALDPFRQFVAEDRVLFYRVYAVDAAGRRREMVCRLAGDATAQEDVWEVTGPGRFALQAVSESGHKSDLVMLEQLRGDPWPDVDRDHPLYLPTAPIPPHLAAAVAARRAAAEQRAEEQPAAVQSGSVTELLALVRAAVAPTTHAASPPGLTTRDILELVGKADDRSLELVRLLNDSRGDSPVAAVALAVAPAIVAGSFELARALLDAHARKIEGQGKASILGGLLAKAEGLLGGFLGLDEDDEPAPAGPTP